MRLSFKRGEKGFTLIEIIIVLAVMAVLAAVVVPNVTGFLGRGKERSWNADQGILQAAVDSWRTDIGNRVGNPWPTIGALNAGIGGTIGDPADGGTPDGDFVDAADTNSFIDIAALATGNYIKGADAVKSALKDATNIGSTNTNDPSGSYAWYIDSNGVVQSWYPADDTLGTSVDIDTGEKGFQTDIYP